MKEAGVTLLELLVTVTLVFLLLSVAVPSFNALIQNSRLASSTNHLVTALNLARSEAVKRNAKVSVISASNTVAGWEDGWSVGIDLNEDGDLNDTNELLLREFEPLDGEEDLTSNASSVVFQPTGFSEGVGSPPAEVWFKVELPDVDRWRRIQINFTGGIVVERRRN